MSNEDKQQNQLFYVRADDVDGNNLDLHVVAEKQADVFAFWRDAYGLLETDMPEWVRAIPGVSTNRAPGPIGWNEFAPD